jgi:hypothetical protein
MVFLRVFAASLLISAAVASPEFEEDPDSLVLLQTRSQVVRHHADDDGLKKPHLDASGLDGDAAPLNERGYQALVKLKDDNETKTFIRRVAAELGYTPGQGSAGALKGLAPYYSGTKAKRTYAALEKELTKIAGQKKSWLTPKGTKASLDEDGFNAVSSLKDTLEMAPFIKRLAEDMLDMAPVKDAGFNGLVPFYSGEKAHGSFLALQEELVKESTKSDGWLGPMHGAIQHEGEKCADPCHDALARGSSCNRFCGQGHLCASNVSSEDKDLDNFVCTKVVSGASQPLNEAGYGVVQKLKNTTQMAKFVRRIIDTLDLKILNEKALHVVIPFYSGEKDKRTYETLLKEIKTAGNQTDGWLSRRGMTAPLDETGFEIVKKLNSVPEMSKYIRRALDAKGLYVRSEGYLNGIAAFYGGEDTKTSFAALQKEIRDNQNDPNLGHKGDKNDPALQSEESDEDKKDEKAKKDKKK